MITLDRVTDVKRHEDGTPWTWKFAGVIAKFNSADEAVAYVDDHIAELPEDCTFFTGSASLLHTLNSYLAKKQQEAK
jgi:hypothetical protein